MEPNACQDGAVDDAINGPSISHSSWETVDESEIDEKVISKWYTSAV
jgi:hypothetical protein